MRNDHRGFTLLEILVALVLIGLLVGTLVPAVLNQLGRGETNRLVEDLRGIETGAKSFRTDVSRWPGSLRQLGQRPGTGTVPSTDILARTIPAGAIARWNGPYLDKAVADSIVTTSGAVITAPFDTTSAYGATLYLRVKIKGVSHEQARSVSAMIDGDTTVGFTNVNAQRVRWRAGAGAGLGVDTMYYFAAPIQ